MDDYPTVLVPDWLRKVLIERGNLGGWNQPVELTDPDDAVRTFMNPDGSFIHAAWGAPQPVTEQRVIVCRTKEVADRIIAAQCPIERWLSKQAGYQPRVLVSGHLPETLDAFVMVITPDDAFPLPALPFPPVE